MHALMEARGKELRSELQIRNFIEQDLPFHLTGTYGGHTPCVEIGGPVKRKPFSATAVPGCAHLE